jgi:hypothetical protein
MGEFNHTPDAVSRPPEADGTVVKLGRVTAGRAVYMNPEEVALEGSPKATRNIPPPEHRRGQTDVSPPEASHAHETATEAQEAPVAQSGGGGDVPPEIPPPPAGGEPDDHDGDEEHSKDLSEDFVAAAPSVFAFTGNIHERRIDTEGGYIEGGLEPDDPTTAKIDYVSVEDTGKGKGTELVRKFATDAIKAGVETLTGNIIDRGALRLRSQLFGFENLTITEDHAGETYTLPITQDQAEASLTRASEVEHPADPSIKVSVDLTNTDVRYGLGLPPPGRTGPRQ